MNRRRLLIASGLGVTSLAGCLSVVLNSRSGTPTGSSHCETRTFPFNGNPSKDDVAIDYEVSGGEKGIQYEMFNIVNISDSRIGLSGYGVVFDGRRALEIDSIELIPSAELWIVTHGDSWLSEKTDSCLKYTHVEHFPLDEPVFDDGRARIRLIDVNGNDIVVEEITA